jgi:hypothetical protein
MFSESKYNQIIAHAQASYEQSVVNYPGYKESMGNAVQKALEKNHFIHAWSCMLGLASQGVLRSEISPDYLSAFLEKTITQAHEISQESIQQIAVLGETFTTNQLQDQFFYAMKPDDNDFVFALSLRYAATEMHGLGFGPHQVEQMLQTGIRELLTLREGEQQ